MREKAIKIKRKRCASDWFLDIFKVVFLVLVTVICVYPFWNIFVVSINDATDALRGGLYFLPRKLSLASYKDILGRATFLHGILITVLRTAIGTPLAVLVTTALAYVLSRKELLFRKQLNLFFIFTMYFGGGMIPNYVLMTYLGLRDTVAAFILPGLIGTYYVLLMKSFFAGIPRELEEAGSIDGLTHIGIFFKIVLPLSKPIMATMALFYMTGYWSNWFNAFLYLDDKKKWPVAYYLRQIINGSATSNDPGATADAAQIASNIKSCCMVLTAAPLICIYPFIQKYFVQGMMLGGVKE